MRSCPGVPQNVEAPWGFSFLGPEYRGAASTQSAMATPVRILSLLVFVAVMATGQLRVLLIGVAVLIGAAIGLWQHHHGFDVQSLLRMMRRVRWLLLAILILYGWFTPGTALIPAWAPYSPSLEGLQQGLLRAAVLLVIVAAVYLLITTTPRGDLVAGLLWCGRPLRRLGVDDQRFAVRLVLALEAVPEVQTLARAALDKVPRAMPRIARLGHAAAAVFQATLTHAEQPTAVIDVPDLQPVPLWQWAIPVTLAAVMLAAAAA